MHPVQVGCTLPQLSAPCPGRVHSTSVGCTLSRSGALYHSWVHPVQVGCSLPQLGAPCPGRVHSTSVGCTLSRSGALYLSWVHPVQVRCSLPQLGAPCPGQVHSTSVGCTLSRSGALYLSWVHPPDSPRICCLMQLWYPMTCPLVGCTFCSFGCTLFKSECTQLTFGCTLLADSSHLFGVVLLAALSLSGLQLQSQKLKSVESGALHPCWVHLPQVRVHPPGTQNRFTVRFSCVPRRGYTCVLCQLRVHPPGFGAHRMFGAPS